MNFRVDWNVLSHKPKEKHVQWEILGLGAGHYTSLRKTVHPFISVYNISIIFQ